MKRLLTLGILTILLASMGMRANAVNITRYVSEKGTGDGLSKENPTPNLAGVLALSKQINGVITIYCEPGTYNVPAQTDDLNGTVYHNYIDLRGGVVYEGDKICHDTANPSVIIGQLAIAGSYVENIRVKGDALLYNTNATRLEADGIEFTWNHPQDYMLNECKANDCKGPGIYIKSIWGRVSGRTLTLQNCEGLRNKGDGLAANTPGNRVLVLNSRFDNNTGMGIDIGDAAAAEIYNTTMNNNSDGGFSNFGIASQSNLICCTIAGNTHIKENRNYTPSSAIWINDFATLDAANCLIYNNKCTALCSGSKTWLTNCTVTNNQGGFHYKGEDRRSSSSNTLTNCLFFGNGKDFPNGMNFRVKTTGIEGGTGIPELDAEQGIIALNASNLGFDPGNPFTIQENSIIINRGSETGLVFDYYSKGRSYYDSPDLGAIEYSGKFVTDATAKPSNISGTNMALASTVFKDKTFYIFAPVSKEAFFPDIRSLYLGTKKTVSLVAGTEQPVVVATSTNGGRGVCDIYGFLWTPYMTRSWVKLKTINYTPAKGKPVIKAAPSNPKKLLVTSGGRTTTINITLQP